MSDSSRTANQSLDYRFLLLAHMVCADGQLHKKEAQMLEELAAQIRVGKGTLAEMKKIFTQDQGQMSVERVAHRVTRHLQYEAMQQMLAVACVDGSCSPSERQMANQVAQIWNWPEGEMEKLLEQAEDIHLLTQSESREGEKDNLSFGARLLAGADFLMSRSLVDKLGQIAPDNVGRKVEHLRREILLSGPEYDEAIARCAAISREDFPLAKKALQQTIGTLLDLAKNLQEVVREIQNKTRSNPLGSTEQEAAQQLEQIQQELRAEILKQVHSVRASLEAKQRAVNYFTIAFMGKTQVGKTTLQAIITGESWDAIGGRKQHSTPLNRVYEWKNLRIIETPGIGMPGGQSDEAIPKSVIEEADIICYTVTTGSIQESEFKFLRLLKEKAKPLIILLNVKYNLRDSRRLQSFLKNPDRPFSQEYNSSLSRDIERIRCYAKAHYGNNSFEIVPVMLRAAHMAREPQHAKQKTKLFQASRMQDCLDSIRESLVEHGALRRSQTMLGSTVGAIQPAYQWAIDQTTDYQQLSKTLKRKHQELQQRIEKTAQEVKESLRVKIEAIFQDAVKAIPCFAKEHWNSNEVAMKRGWEQKLNCICFESRLKTAYTEAGEQFNKEVSEALEALRKELELVPQLNSTSSRVIQQVGEQFIGQKFLKISDTIVAIADRIALGVAPTVEGVLTAAGMTMGVIPQICQSKEEKYQAVQKIIELFSENLKFERQKALKETDKHLSDSFAKVAQKIILYFVNLQEGIEGFARCLESSRSQFYCFKTDLNKAYAKRIIDCCLEQYEPIADAAIQQTIAKVERKLGQHINIFIRPGVKLNTLPPNLKLVLQEDIKIIQ